MKKIFLILIIISCSCIITNAQWVQVNNGIGNAEVRALASIGNTVLAGTENGIFLTTNNGNNWLQTSFTFRVISLTVNTNKIIAGTYNEGTYISTNNGVNWHQTINNRDVYALAANGNSLFSGTGYPNGLYISTNNGTNWSLSTLSGLSVLALAIDGGNTYGGTYGVYKSTNNGINWNITSLNNHWVHSLIVSTNRIFAGVDGGLFLSTNNGTSWSQTSLSISNSQWVAALAISDNTVFAGTINYSSGIYVSNNNGASWVQKNEGLLLYGTNVESLCILNNYIYAGGDEGGVYRRPLSELIGIQSISNEIPKSFSLYQNYPNPFNPSTSIKFDIPKAGNVSLKIYDITGKEVYSINEFKSAGQYEFTFDATNYASGLYFYKVESGLFIETKKMVLIK